ncbi:hypothetical protein DERP_012060 [Dermatophagoides pteronyssinus]|uniref:C2H2-type domain-containing protein n=1 Tax=Dermatophagoides pteronyssinus TaxID=6956 RepID=A0ABQ8IU46_DERPT|nr:hypothetical protein DERP_012060 [Dermatophagoides pteronyssinus]
MNRHSSTSSLPSSSNSSTLSSSNEPTSSSSSSLNVITNSHNTNNKNYSANSTNNTSSTSVLSIGSSTLTTTTTTTPTTTTTLSSPTTTASTLSITNKSLNSLSSTTSVALSATTLIDYQQPQHNQHQQQQHAKSLKMKIKRKNIGGKISEINHEIVSSDTATASSSSSSSMASVTASPLSSSTQSMTSNVVSSKSSPYSTINSPATITEQQPNSSHISLNNPTTTSTSSTTTTTAKNINDSNHHQHNNSVIINNNKKDVDENIADRVDSGTMTSIATITEPDCLGPCEPGTSVTLEGIVWQETENGVLVVNITWRGKTYVGTLLDCTKHDWAPPRFCESPTSDIESKSLKNTRGKRARNSFIAENSIDTRSVTSKLRNGKGRRTANSGYVPSSPAKSDSAINSSLSSSSSSNNKRKGRPSELDLAIGDDNAMSGNGKRNKISNINCDSGQPNSPALIECPEPNCSKKYRHINGLKYHQSHAHFGSTFTVSDTQEFNDSQTNDPTSNTDETTPIKGGDVSDSDNNDSDSPIKKSDSQQNETPDQSSELKNSNGTNDDATLVDDCNKSSHSASSSQHKIVTESIDSKNIDQSDVASDSDLGKNNCEMVDDKPVASPAFSDISDDNSNNNDSNSGSGGVVGVASTSSSSESKVTPKSQDSSIDTNGSKKISTNQFNPLGGSSNSVTSSPLPHHFFNKSQFLIPPNHQTDSSEQKSNNNDLNNKEDNKDNSITSDSRQPFSPYPPSLYSGRGFGGSSSNNNDCGNIKSDNETKDNSITSGAPGSAIAELQNLKNRIQYSFDQQPGNNVIPYSEHLPKQPSLSQPPPPLQPSQHPKFSSFDMESRLKDKVGKYSSTQTKIKSKDHKDDSNSHHQQSTKDSSNKTSKHDEGIKPTMESTGPPPITNGYYYSPSFLPPSFGGPSPFDAMFRSGVGPNSMNPMVMGPPYGPSQTPSGPERSHIPSMHPPPLPPRHSLHTSAIGYPIFDPYSAMIVNHTVPTNTVHQFTPK